MRFLMLMAEPDHFENWRNADATRRDRVMGDFHAFAEAANHRGTILAGEALDQPGTARTVRPGARVVTQGPFAESVEQLGGFYLVEAPDRDTAVALATLLPREYLVEVRPVVDVAR